MRRLSPTPLLLGLAVACCLVLTPQPGRSQGANKGIAVRFNTADGVTLKGTFYPAAKRDSTCVLMLHALGANEDSNKAGWQQLAQALNEKKGFAVLTFDFRGHGESTTVNPDEFWGGKAGPTNQALLPKAFGRNNIEFKDFPKTYYPLLLNDIAAAKAFLDHRNDTGDCNTSALVVLGAESGATLGAIWAHSEFSRYKVEMTQGFGVGQPFPIQQAKLAKNPEGKSTLACVWLSLSPGLYHNAPDIAKSHIYGVGKTKEVPMYFLFGDKDIKAEKYAKDMEKIIKGSKTTKAPKIDRFPFTVAASVPGADEKLRGRGLLEVRGADTAIATYVDNVSKDRAANWVEQEFNKSGYVWRLGFSQFIPVKYPGERTLIFSSFQPFLR